MRSKPGASVQNSGSFVANAGGQGARKAKCPPDKRIEFRVGIHQGDIIIDGGDIFGDGVNVAARLEGLAEPGGICVSSRVQEDAQGFSPTQRWLIESATNSRSETRMAIGSAHFWTPRRRSKSFAGSSSGPKGRSPSSPMRRSRRCLRPT
jgi:Adenylate and Guanylate cyclase catalytic domain